jgi:superfamily I DNA and RNA helicase
MKHENDATEIAKAVIKGAISNVPIVGSVITEIMGYLDSKYISERLEKLERTVRSLDILVTDFTERLYDLEHDEHKYYVVRNNLKFLCLTALPETVDSFNKALIEVIMSDRPTMAEYACEIIKQLNADDISVLETIKEYQISQLNKGGELHD